MPTSFLSADAGFPRLTGDVPAEERMNRIRDYLFLLLEQLRYVLSNLGEENFNDAALREIEEKMTGPIRSVVSDLAGNVSTLEQTAEALTARVSDAEGNISTLEVTARSITSRINDVDGRGSTIEQTAERLNFAVFDPAGNVSLVSQKADRIDWIVASGTSAATMALTPEAIDLVAQGINISGYVTFTKLENPADEAFINGSNMLLKSDSTGNSGSYLQFLNDQNHDYGQLWTVDTHDRTVYDSFFDDVMFTLQSDGGVDGKTCGLWLLSLGRLLAQGSGVQIRSSGEIVLDPATNTFIKGTNALTGEPGYYSFRTDGIYYGNTRVLAV